MGLSPFSEYSSDGGITIVNTNPNPSNFIIKGIVDRYDGYLIVRINYPNCINFGGDKILVYKGITKKELLARRTLDPHFDENSKFSPIARFEPTDNGITAAIVCVEAFYKRGL